MKRRIIFLNGRKRFTQSGTNLRPSLPQYTEYLALLVRQLLGLRDGSACVAIPRIQANNVFSSEIGNRPIQHGRGAKTQTDLLSQVACQFHFRVLFHQAQSLLNLIIGDDFKKWRLLQLYRKPLSERAVENWISGRIGEIRHDDGVATR